MFDRVLNTHVSYKAASLHSIAGVFVWIWRYFSDQFFYRTPTRGIHKVHKQVKEGGLWPKAFSYCFIMSRFCENVYKGERGQIFGLFERKYFMHDPQAIMFTKKTTFESDLLSLFFIFNTYSWLALSWRRPLSHRNQSIDMITASVMKELTHFIPVLRFIWKLVIWFAVQNKWLVSI